MFVLEISGVDAGLLKKPNMLPYNCGAGGRPAHRNGSYPPPPVPRYPNLDGVNSFQLPGQDRFPVYEWKPRPPTTFPGLPSQTPPMNNRRKRQNSDYSPHVVKHPRLDSTSHPFMSPPVIRMPPPNQPDRAVASSSRLDYDRYYSSPYSRPHPPESPTSSQIYAKDKLSDQIVELFEACRQQPSDLARKEMCRSRLQQDINRVYAGGFGILCPFQDYSRENDSPSVFFPVARLYLTGSSMNELGCRSSDADLCLVIKGNKRPNPLQVLPVLQRLFGGLLYIEKTQLIRAKVPILRFREKGSNLEFDLNVNNTVGIRNTFLLRAYSYADRRIKPMILVVKKWARHHQINDASKGTLTRKEPVIPSLQMDYPECFNPFVDVDLVPEGPKRIPPYISRNQAPLGELLLGFLEYYAIHFRWDKYVISVREAQVLPKTNSQQWKNKYICVEEPFERNNVARAVHEKAKFDAIRAQFAESFHILKQRRDLNSILPIRDIITKESSMR
ncbi:poly(A) RNA polymerase GLD2 isoform X2 [Takifugu rubripes]|uniref:poly(A) RNA polymerase GLD2 isoform X2 n=1 Tax=Takifugu rubripes TaxID=31033 RepID=UPI00114529C6|nr:poly(A) RNA polymerase GLD2 isoform X2 [Takifugu rubripes]